MATVDDMGCEREQLDREMALKIRRPAGPEACGTCLNCGEPLAVGMRWCDEYCRDDWQAHQRLV